MSHFLKCEKKQKEKKVFEGLFSVLAVFLAIHHRFVVVGCVLAVFCGGLGI